jgi:hypothetical protein
LVDLQGEFNRVSRRLVRQLDRLYVLLGAEFDNRFSPKFKVGFGGQQRPSGQVLPRPDYARASASLTAEVRC